MARTFIELRDEALHDDFDPVKYAARAERAVNDALGDLARRIELPAQQKTTTITTVAGTTAYSVPSDFVRLLSLHRDDGLLEEISVDEYDVLDPDNTGTPAAFVLFGSQLYLWPQPDGAEDLTLRYTAAPAALSGSADITTVVPDVYADLAVKFARSRLFAYEDDPQMADWWMAQYEQGLLRARGDLQRQSRPKRQIGDWRRRRLPRFRLP